MDSNLSDFNLSFVDAHDLDFDKIGDQDCEYDDLHPTLSPGSLLGADDAVLAHFLSGDPLEEPDLNGPTTLQCEICRKRFDNAKKYYGHLRVHSKSNLWKCDECPNENFSTKQQLMKHSLTHQPLERVWRCPLCEMSFEALTKLQQHLLAKHLDNRSHKCELCPKTFHKLSDLDKHMDVHTAVKKHACTVCQKKFTDKSNLKSHMLSHGDEKAYACAGCGNPYKQNVDGHDLDFDKIGDQDCEYDDLQPTLTPESLLGAEDDVLAEFLSGDPLDEPDSNGPTTQHCDIWRKRFDNAKKHYGHLRVHSKDNLWKCDECPNENFSTKHQLMKHSLTHQPLEREWKCPQCEMSFEVLAMLQQHLLAKHLDNRSHKCELCPKTFHKLSDLDKHIDIHTAVKKHACTVCQKKFTDKSNLKSHMLSHGDEKAYACAGCGNPYKQNVDGQDLDFDKIGDQDCEYDDLQPTLTPESLLGADDDVLAEFLSGDPLDEPDSNGPTTQHCDIWRKRFDNAKKHYGHLRVHSKDNLWKCDECPNENFSTKQQLMKHSLTHQPLEREWKCPQCEMSFEALAMLRQHLLAKHSDYRSHKCELCPKTFHKLSDLDKHIDIHTAVKKHACTVCQKKFTDKSNLKSHMLSHGDEKAYACAGCGNPYKQNVDGQDLDFDKIGDQDCEYDDLQPTLSPGSLLGADDDVLAEFLSGDPLDEPDSNGPTTQHCDIWRKRFDNAKKHYGHLRVHSKDNLWKCDECPNENFSTKQQLMKHSLTHQPLEREWNCPQCEMSFEALAMLQQHLLAKHSDYRPHKCELCPKTFQKLSDLDKHMDVHSGVKKHACTVCQRKFPDKSNLIRHMLSHGDETAYPCADGGNRCKQNVDGQDLDFDKIGDQDCEYDDLHPTLSPGSLLGADDDVLAEFLSGDPLEEPDLNGPTTLHCEICGKRFDNAKKYYGHLRVHSKDNVWKCDECPNENFSTKQQLMKHSLTHKPLKREWKCPQCEMTFEALWRLQQHLFAKHLDYRPHKCELCPKTFHKLSDLGKHMDIHAGVKKHECTVCQKKFTDKSNLNRHMLIHGDEKAYACTGCGNRYKQIASLHSHRPKCPLVIKNPDSPESCRKNYCRDCGITFKYKISLLEHCVREHSNNPSLPHPEPPKEDKSNELHVDTDRTVDKIPPPEPPKQYMSNELNGDTRRTVDKIVDDILSAEDDYMTMSTQNDLINYPEVNQLNQDLLKEINQEIGNIPVNNIIYDDELIYNTIDIDSFQTMCNNIDVRNVLVNLNDARSEEDDIMDRQSPDQDKDDTQILVEDIPKEKVNEFLNSPVSVNDCSTIFESDVDLEGSKILAENLNHLVRENNVQYISTEHDDTFIISLNSEIDAEQLTDMLNIGMEDKPFRTGECAKEPKILNNYLDCAEEGIELEGKTVKPKRKSRLIKRYACLKCGKIFKKKDNYISHRGTHNGELREYRCKICQLRFSYKSTLNKHTRKKHTPFVRTESHHACFECSSIYETPYQLQKHKILDHNGTPYQCDVNDCMKKFFSQWDLDVHKKSHSVEKPHACDICSKTFKTRSHLTRHKKHVKCSEKSAKPKPVPSKKPEPLTGATKDPPIINLYVCDDLNSDKKRAKVQKVQTDAEQDATKMARNVVLLPLKFVKEGPKNLKDTETVNPRSLLTPTARKVNNMPETISGKPINYNNNFMNVESEQHSRQFMMNDENGINMKQSQPKTLSKRAKDNELLQNALIKEPVLAKLPNTKTDINVENDQHPNNPNETWQIEIIKDNKLDKVLNTNIPIISEPLKSETEINVNRNEQNLQMNEMKQLANDESFRKVPKIGRPVTVVPLSSEMEIDDQDNVKIGQNSKNKTEILKDDRLHKVLNMKRPITEDLNAKIEMNAKKREKHSKINENMPIYIFKGKRFTLADNLNSKMEEVKPQLASGISLTKPLTTTIESKNLNTDELQIKTFNGEFILEPLNLQTKIITKKPAETKLRNSIPITDETKLKAQFNKSNVNLQSPKSGSFFQRALVSKKENTSKHYETFKLLESPNFEMERVKPESKNVEQNKSKNLLVTNKLNLDRQQTADLKIKIITPVSEENKVQTPTGNFVVASNSNILITKVSGFNIADFFVHEKNLQPLASQQSYQLTSDI